MLQLVFLKENKNEKRIFILPEDILSSRNSNVKIYIPIDYGKHLGITNEQYMQVGALLYTNVSNVLNHADCVFKLSPLSGKELKKINRNSILFSNPYFASHPAYLRTVLASALNLSAIESIKYPNNTYLNKLDEVKGELAYNFISMFNSPLYNPESCGISSNNKCKYLVYGYSNAAIQLIYKLILNNHDIIFLDDDDNNLKLINQNPLIVKALKFNSNSKIECVKYSFNEIYKYAKTINGTIACPTNYINRCEIKFPYDFITAMPKGSVFVDLCCELGFSSDVNFKTNNLNKKMHAVKGISIASFYDISQLYPLTLAHELSKFVSLQIISLIKTDTTPLMLLNNKLIQESLVTTKKDNIGVIVNKEIADALKLKSA